MSKMKALQQEEMDLFIGSVFRMWEEHTDGFVDVYEKDGKTMVTLRTMEDDYTFDSIADAVGAVLYTIGEWIKEA